MRKSAVTLVAFAGLALALPVQAFCPVCAVAVGAGLGLSRWLGVDDVVSSLWIGGIIISLVIWTLNWMGRKRLRFSGDQVSMAALYYLLFLVPLYFMGIVGHPLNVIWGVDKIIFGTAVGSLIFLAAAWLHDRLKKRNAGKSYFAFQKVVLPVLSLAVFSFVLNYLK